MIDEGEERGSAGEGSTVAVAEVRLPGESERVLPIRVWARCDPAPGASGEQQAQQARLVAPGLVPASCDRFELDAQLLADQRIPALEVSVDRLFASPQSRPAVVVMPGRGDPGWTNAGLCAALAADGAVVLELAHPADSPTLDEAGELIPVRDDLRDVSVMAELVGNRVGDLTRVVAELQPGGALADLGADPGEISAVGHSLGGAAAAEAAASGVPLRSVVVLDGKLHGAERTGTGGVPTLLLTAYRPGAPLGWQELGEIEGVRVAWITADDTEHYAFTELAARPELVAGWSPERHRTWFGAHQTGSARETAIALVESFLGLSDRGPFGTRTDGQPVLEAEQIPAGWQLRWAH